MQNLTERDKRTLRLATIAIVIYLALFFGLKTWKGLEKKRADYQTLLADTLRLKRELLPAENQALLTEKLKEAFRLEPLKLSRTTLVAEASAALQKAAQGGGVMIGPIRESASRPNAKELTSMQLEAVGPIPALLTLLHNMGSLGFPLVVDSLQMSLDPAQPNMVKVNLTIVVLDFEQWKKEVIPHA